MENLETIMEFVPLEELPEEVLEACAYTGKDGLWFPKLEGLSYTPRESRRIFHEYVMKNQVLRYKEIDYLCKNSRLFFGPGVHIIDVMLGSAEISRLIIDQPNMLVYDLDFQPEYRQLRLPI